MEHLHQIAEFWKGKIFPMGTHALMDLKDPIEVPNQQEKASTSLGNKGHVLLKKEMMLNRRVDHIFYNYIYIFLLFVKYIE